MPVIYQDPFIGITRYSEIFETAIPAADSSDKGNWAQDETSGKWYNANLLMLAPIGSVIFQSCTDPSAYTDHGLKLVYEDNDYTIWIDSLPETECTLTLVFVPYGPEVAPKVMPPMGVGEGSGNANIITADSVEKLPDPSTVPEGTIGIVPSEGMTLTSPNGTKYLITVSDDGEITATAVTS